MLAVRTMQNQMILIIFFVIRENTRLKHRCLLRNSKDLRTMHCRTNLFYNSFYQLLKEHETKETSLLNKQLPSHPLNIYSKHPPKEYNYRTRNGQIIHARLRMECSSLNSHLYRKNDSPSSTCGGFKSP